MTNLQNFTVNELATQADHDNNTLALHLLNRVETETAETLEELIDDQVEPLKEAYLTLLGEKINAYTEQWGKEFEKDGYEFVSYAECFDESVANECNDTEKLCAHIEEVLTTEQYKCSGLDDKATWANHITVHIDQKAYDLYVGFSDDQMKELGELVSQDIPTYFDCDTYSGAYLGKESFYSACYGEQENQLDGLDIFEEIPTNADNERIVSDDEINTNIDAYLSGDSLYLDLSYEGIYWSINLDFLEQAILEVQENTEFRAES